MSDQSFEQMLEESFKTIHTGEVVKGTVLDVKEDQIILNIGYKSDGIITRNEYSNNNSLDLRTVVQPGEEMEAKVMKVNDGDGQVALSYRRLAADRGNKRLEDAYNNHEVLTAKVVQVLNGGLSVTVTIIYYYLMLFEGMSAETKLKGDKKGFVVVACIALTCWIANFF